MGLLDGQQAIVTGGGSGIGRATARRMAEEGAAVTVLDIDGDAARAVAEEIGGGFQAADVTDADGLRRAVDDAVAAMGGLTILFNNAGTGSQAPLHRWDPEEWNRLVAVNLTGVFHGFRAAVPHLLASGGGASSPPRRSAAPGRPPARPRTRRPRPAWWPSPPRPPWSTARGSG